VGGGSPGTAFLQWHICWPKLPVTRLSTGICSLVLIHASAISGTAGGAGSAGAPGIPGTAGGFGGVSGGKVYCLPITSIPATILIPRSFTIIAGVVGMGGAPGIPGIAGGVTPGTGGGGIAILRNSSFT